MSPDEHAAELAEQVLRELKQERDMIGLIRQACHEIQDGDRDDA